MKTSKREHVLRALEQIPVGEFTAYDVRDNCTRDLTIREISSHLRNIEGVRFVRRGASCTDPAIWEKIDPYLTRKVGGFCV